MKKSEKLKGKEKVSARKEQYKMAGIAAAIIVLVIAVIAIYFVFVVPPVVVAAGDTVNVTYTLMFDNKTVYQTNVNTSPFTFTVGSGQVLPGFDAAVRGMKVNEEKTVMIPADQGYVYNPDRVAIVPKSLFPRNQTIYPGEKAQFYSNSGSVIPVVVLNVTDAGVAVDANSPLVGQNLTFVIRIDSIQKATASSAAATATS
ncbi:FKBP-type peptidyl-prolyl cis-trans isomerase [Methanoregula sp.]|uniref:FKBP-type peptidyl-prolyl cis-trans isomerase n=1 Tax=Methanoregula sp. TaxID=2052170 RepID=UPI003BB11105